MSPVNSAGQALLHQSRRRETSDTESCRGATEYRRKSSGNGNVAMGVNSNHILQFPRQPKRDDGKWVAIGSLIGALLGKIASWYYEAG